MGGFSVLAGAGALAGVVASRFLRRRGELPAVIAGLVVDLVAVGLLANWDRISGRW
jgi:anti-sigma-K factor RskA